MCTADGAVFRGRSVGADGVTTGEAVFNTSMTGYQEILTDPSYAGQVVVMTTSHIGNYGVTATTTSRPGRRCPASWCGACRDVTRTGGPRARLGDYLRRHGVVAITDIDTRRLTRHIRDRGAMPVAIGVDVDRVGAARHGVVGALDGRARTWRPVSPPTTPITFAPPATRRGQVVAIDLGMKRDILTNLTGRGLDVDVVPASTGGRSCSPGAPTGYSSPTGPATPSPC